MINIFDWSYSIEKNLVRITFNQPMSNKIIFLAKNFHCSPLTNVKGLENEIYFMFKNDIIANDFVRALEEKYPNKFTLENNWDILQSSIQTISFSCLIANLQTFNSLQALVNSMFKDLNTISLLTKEKISDIELNFDNSGGYMNFNIHFNKKQEATKFIRDFNHFNN